MQTTANHLVDPARARDHLATLLPHTQGSPRPIAKAARLSWHTVARAWTANEPISRWSQDRILSVRIEDLDGHQIWRSPAHSRAHLLALSRHEDFTVEAAAAAAGVSNLEVREILDGTRARVQPHISDAIVRLDQSAVRSHAKIVSSRSAITRIRALQAQQWPSRDLARMLGYTGPGIPFLTRGTQILRDLDAKVAALYHEIGDRKGPSERAANVAMRLGYWPAIHYDDDMHLIPDSIPGHWSSDAERWRRALRVMALTVRGFTAPEIAGLLGLDDDDAAVKHVQRAREQVGLRLNVNITILDSQRVMSGQDPLIREINAHTAGIAIWERVDVLDEPRLDYQALWYSLCDVADLLHGAGEAGAPASSWPKVPEPEDALAATLTEVAA